MYQEPSFALFCTVNKRDYITFIMFQEPSFSSDSLTDRFSAVGVGHFK